MIAWDIGGGGSAVLAVLWELGRILDGVAGVACLGGSEGSGFLTEGMAGRKVVEREIQVWVGSRQEKRAIFI